MANFIDEQFKINIYLDTNIIVDYIEGENMLLVNSLDYLAQCGFVILHSSHYVEFEFAEVRKKRLFFYMVHHRYPQKDEHIQYAQEKWILKNRPYSDFKNVITQRVIQDLQTIETKLEVRFDDHVLHEKLIMPARDLCLSSKISREDSMVMTSCMYPNVDEILQFSVLLSNDKQYSEAFSDNKQDASMVFTKYGLMIPTFMNAKALNNGSQLININQPNPNFDTVCFWNKLLLNLIKEKNKSTLVGQTQKTNNFGLENGLIYLDTKSYCSELEDSQGLFFIPADLSETIEIEKDFNYWNLKIERVLPYNISPIDTTFSFKSKKINPMTLEKLQKNKYLIFYSK